MYRYCLITVLAVVVSVLMNFGYSLSQSAESNMTHHFKSTELIGYAQHNIP
jgi:hypothetical protein